jgi:hypothetical protein
MGHREHKIAYYVNRHGYVNKPYQALYTFLAIFMVIAFIIICLVLEYFYLTSPGLEKQGCELVGKDAYVDEEAASV